MGKGETLREAAWTESPGHRGLAALQSRQKPGRQLERGRVPAARQQASPLCSQPWTSCTLSPSPRTPLCAPPAVTRSHALGVTHDYTCLSPCSTQPRQGLLTCQGGETDWGHLHAWDPVPCGCRGRSHHTPGAPGPSAGWTFPWSHCFSVDSLPQPPCSFHTPDGSQGPAPQRASPRGFLPV